MNFINIDTVKTHKFYGVHCACEHIGKSLMMQPSLLLCMQAYRIRNDMIKMLEIKVHNMA